MRPQEILSMIEEAAGTSMFEEKKDKAVKTMARKEKRLDEIQELLREEITPKLDRLREEKRAFLEFQKKSSELERLSKLVIAFDWTQLEVRKVKATEDVEGAQARLKESVAGRGRMEGEIKRMEKEIGDIQKRRDKVSGRFLLSFGNLFLGFEWPIDFAPCLDVGLPMTGTRERWQSANSGATTDWPGEGSQQT